MPQKLEDDKGLSDRFFDELRETVREARSGAKDSTLRALLRKNEELMAEHSKYRRRLAKRVALKEGEAVLSAEDAKAWREFQKLGKKPADLRKELEDSAKIRAESERASAQANEQEAAKSFGWDKSIGLFRRLLKADGLSISFEDAKDEEGSIYRRPLVASASAPEKTTPLEKYAKDHWTDALAALVGEEDEDSGRSRKAQASSRKEDEPEPRGGPPSSASRRRIEPPAPSKLDREDKAYTDQLEFVNYGSRF